MTIRRWLYLMLPLAIGLSSPAIAAPDFRPEWHSLLPDACTPEEGDIERTEPLWPAVVPLVDAIESREELERIAERLAAEHRLNLREARVRVARFAAQKALSTGEASAALSLLHALWVEGDQRAILPYAALASRWPSLKPSPSAEQALMAAALGGDPDAFIELARMRREPAGDMGRAAPAAALAAQGSALLWTRVASGNCDALLSLAQLALHPLQGSPAPDLAVELLRAGVERRGPAAALALADLHLAGLGVPYDARRAIELLEAAGEWGHKPALLRLARLYLSGPLPVRSRSRAEAVLAKLSKGEEPQPSSVVMLMAEDAAGRFGGRPDDERAADLLANAQQNPDRKADDLLARAHLEGWSGWIDIEAAEKALLSSIRHGSRDAIWTLAQLKLLADGTSEQALRLTRWAASQGSVPAMVQLKGMSVAGTAPPEDGTRAKELLLQAARSGSTSASRAVAADLFHDAVLGDGTFAALAERALQEAVRQGSVVAAFELERAYQAGILKMVEPRPEDRPALLERVLSDVGAGPDRMLEIGRAYAGSTGLGVQPSSALAWFRKCAALGEPRCHAELAAAGSREGFDQLVGAAEQEESLNAAAESGDAQALYVQALAGEETRWDEMWIAARLGYLPAVLALLESAGRNEGRIDEAMRWLEWGRALAFTSIEEAVSFARAYRNGTGVPKDSDAALQYFLMAARLGSAAAMREVGTIALRRSDPEFQVFAEEWLTKATMLGDLPAMERLAEAYYDDRMGRHAPDDAFRIALLAAARGSIRAKRMVAEALEIGFGTAVDFPAAARWHREAAESGDTASMVWLAEHLLARDGKNEASEALDWLRRAAAEADQRAIYLLGKVHEEGEHVARDPAAAERYFRAAAEAGHLPSVLKLSSLRDAERGPSSAVSEPPSLN